MAKTPPKNSRRERYTKLTLKKISAVDRPAQEGADAVVIMKRDTREPIANVSNRVVERVSVGDQSIEREVNAAKQYEKPAMTTSVAGHAHLLDVGCSAGQTDYARAVPVIPRAQGEYYSSHSHPYLVDSKGSVTIGEAEGHTHEVAIQARKSDAGDGDEQTNTSNLSENETMGAQAATKTTETNDVARIAELEGQLATAKALATMSDVQKAYHAKLEGAARVDFEKAAPAEREALVSKSVTGRRLVYKSLGGDEFYENDDPRMVAAVKRADENEKALAKANYARETEVYKRRAKEELGHLPGEIETHVVLLKAVDTIADEAQRTKVLEVLKANDAGLGAAFETRGASGGDGEEIDANDPEEALDAMVQKYASEKKVSFEKAYVAVLETDEGRELYAMLEVPSDSRALGKR